LTFACMWNWGIEEAFHEREDPREKLAITPLFYWIVLACYFSYHTLYWYCYNVNLIIKNLLIVYQLLNYYENGAACNSFNATLQQCLPLAFIGYSIYAVAT
jgi:hypothetical protein